VGADDAEFLHTLLEVASRQMPVVRTPLPH